MKDYLVIGNTINLLSIKTEYHILSIILFIICGLIFLFSIQVGIEASMEYTWSDKFKKSIPFFLIFIVGGLFLFSGLYVREIDRNYYNKKVMEYMKKEGLENVDPVKLLTNIQKVENFNGVIPVKFKKTTRYGSYYDKNSYYNYLLNDYYNGTTNQKEELFKSLEK